MMHLIIDDIIGLCVVVAVSGYILGRFSNGSKIRPLLGHWRSQLPKGVILSVISFVDVADCSSDKLLSVGEYHYKTGKQNVWVCRVAGSFGRPPDVFIIDKSGEALKIDPP